MNRDEPDDKDDFASLMPGVKRLHQDRINQYRHRPIKSPSRKKKEEPVKAFDTLSYQQTIEIRDSWFDHGIQKKLQRRIRQGLLPVDDSLDLHGYTQKSAVKALGLFVDEAVGLGHKFLIIVHGKGQRSQNMAVLKPMTLHWLSQQKSVLAWCPAQPKDGGSGASYVYLR